MPDNSIHLGLQYLQNSQTQKHVSLNSSLTRLDNIIMLSADILNTPPLNPNEGDRFIIGNNPSGAWQGKAGQIAAFINLGYEYYIPKIGFIAFDKTNSKFIYFNGIIWADLKLGNIEGLNSLSIGTQNDINNPLSAKLNSALFSAKYASESGNGDIILTLNKEETTKKAAILMQDNWSGRAEFGLNGNNDFSIKTSSDGNLWQTSLSINSQTARINILGIDFQNPNMNIAIGNNALEANIENQNIALGHNALKYQINGNLNTGFTGSIGIGNDSRVSNSNQIQLGASGTSVYAYGAVQDRSDVRDKADIRDTNLGLEFIKALRPVDFKWDLREDYFNKKDGSKKRNRYHHGFIAQEIESVLNAHNIDFGGFQDHAKNGGADVKTIGYTEFIAPIIKAIQELSAKIELIEKNNTN